MNPRCALFLDDSGNFVQTRVMLLGIILYLLAVLITLSFLKMVGHDDFDK